MRSSLASMMAIVLMALVGSDASAQSDVEATAQAAPAAEMLSVEDFAKPMGPADPLNRGTPRGSLYGFFVACRKGDYARAAEFLDLRRLPPDLQEKGPQLARQLKAVLDNTPWIDFATLSGRNEGLAEDGLPAWQDRLTDIQTREGLITLLIQRVPRDGDAVRIWKIASTTVVQTAALYEEFGPLWLESWLPPVFFEVVVFDLHLWQWLGVVVFTLGGWLIALTFAGTSIRFLSHLFTRRERSLDERIVRVVRGPVQLALAVAVFACGRQYLALDLSVQELVRSVERLLWIVSAAWIVFRLVDIASISIQIRSGSSDDAGLVPVVVPLQRLTKTVIVVFGTLGVLTALGVDITAGLAGLGIGGIAVALAAQKPLENLFGAVSLFADRPVRVGDFFRYGDQMGTLEEIGLRSTRIRTLERSVVTIPNAEFSNLALESLGKRDRIRICCTMGVRYETTPDQIRYLLTRLREILIAHPRITEEPARVRMVGFGAYSLDLEVVAYVDTSDWGDFLAVREDVYLRFMDAVKEAGTSFAFPSSTAYLGRDSGMSEEEARRVGERIAEWREKGEFPFPNIPDDARSEMWNNLDWPPSGSPGASSKG
jgi:MscS family membrane protein